MRKNLRLKRLLNGICGIFPLMHKNAFGRKLEQFHQDQYKIEVEKETQVCQIHKYLDNLKKHLPMKAVYMV